MIMEVRNRVRDKMRDFANGVLLQTRKPFTWFSTGYDAVKTTGKRKAAPASLKHEDEHLKGTHRKSMLGTGRDLARNMSAVGWAIRKHLDYVSTFDFQCRTDQEDLNTHIESLMERWFRPHNCDAASRHPFPRMLRMLEARRVVDGDVFAIKRSDGTLQIVEGDCVRDPEDRDARRLNQWFNGIRTNRYGRSLSVAVHRRTGNGQFAFSREVRAGNVLQHAFFDRFDQVRGISPLSSAFNSFRDVFEGVDYALAKLKVEQLFAMVITSSHELGIGEHEKVDSQYEVDFGKGPVKLEMDPGEDAKFLKTDSPGGGTQEFLNMVLGMAIKSLDLPWNMWDESSTNFFGSRAAWLLYDRACDSKRADVRELLRQITVWKFQQWIKAGVLRLPRGASVADLHFEWIPKGIPWWDPAKELKGDLMAINAGLDNPITIAKSHGRDYEENIKQIARAKEIAKSYDVDLSFRANPNALEVETDNG